MADRLRVGVVGGGLIAQVEHIPNLLALRGLFDLRGVSDPSESVREGISARFGVATYSNLTDLLDLRLDAILIAAPDPWHGVIARQAMNAGLHVFCEKPLCYGLAEIDQLAEVQRRNAVVLQVGYMKRFDPSYEAALDLVSGMRDRLRMVTVEVSDPDAWPFVSHHPLVSATEDLSHLAAESGRLRRSQVIEALGFEPAETIFRGFTTAFCSALVHDVNAVHGLLGSMGIEPGPVLGATLFAGGSGGQAAIDLLAGQALWTLAYTETPGLADYSERITLYFEDETVALAFPAPYLNHHPTRLLHKRSTGGRLDSTSTRPGYEASFVRELAYFWGSIVKGEQARNTVADARRDQKLLIEMAQKAQEGTRSERPFKS